MKSTSVTPKQLSRKGVSNIESNMDDQVIMDDFAQEEAIPLIIFNEERRCKYKIFRNLLIVKFKCRFRNK